jgi:hypothetical protein
VAALVFDTGGLIALERGDRGVAALLKRAAAAGHDAVTSSACVAQAWRDPARQALLTRALSGFLEHPLDPELARTAGRLLADADTSDAVDAAIVALAADGDLLLTSDPRDLRHLASVAGTSVRVLAV